MSLRHQVVIPTHARPGPLRALLLALARQTRQPDGVLVVDDPTGPAIQHAVEDSQRDSPTLRVTYHRNPGPRGSAAARNHGLALALADGADVVTFFDDDVLPAADYLARIQDALARYPQALGAMGFVSGYPRLGRGKMAVARAFGLNRRTATEVDLLPNLNTCYPLDLRAPTPCDWLWGCNMTLRREVLERVQFDRQFVRYSLKEDIKLGLDARAAFPGRRFLMVPDARVQEQRSDAGRLAPSDVARMNVIHRHYILRQHPPGPRLGSLALAWSDVGSLVVYAASKPRELPGRTWGTLRGWAAVVRHRRALRRGDLAPLNAGYRFAKADR